MHLQAEHLLSELQASEAALLLSQANQQLHMTALAAFFKRRVRAAAAQQACRVLALWQRQASRQVGAVWRWRGLAEVLLQQRQGLRDTAAGAAGSARQAATEAAAAADQDEQQQPLLHASEGWQAWQQQLSLQQQQGQTVAGQIVRRKRAPAGSCLEQLRAGKLLAAAFRAWHSYVRLQVDCRVVQQVGCGAGNSSTGKTAWSWSPADNRPHACLVTLCFTRVVVAAP